MSLATGPVARFRTRSLYTVLDSRNTWCKYLPLSPEVCDELELGRSVWLITICSQYGSPSAMRVLYSDASETGYGGYVVEHGPCVAYGQWTSEEAKRRSTWQELAAVDGVISAVAPTLSNTCVRWFTVNQDVARTLIVGSKKNMLHVITLNIFSLAVRYGIQLEPKWIPTELTEKANLLSRVIDLDDWCLNPAVFAQLNRMWGSYTSVCQLQQLSTTTI